MEMEGSGGCSNSSKNNGGDDANSSVVAWRYAPMMMWP